MKWFRVWLVPVCSLMIAAFSLFTGCSEGDSDERGLDSGSIFDEWGLVDYGSRSVEVNTGHYSFNQEENQFSVQTNDEGKLFVVLTRDSGVQDTFPIVDGTFSFFHGELGDGGDVCPEDSYAISGYFSNGGYAHGEVVYAQNCQVVTNRRFTARWHGPETAPWIFLESPRTSNSSSDAIWTTVGQRINVKFKIVNVKAGNTYTHQWITDKGFTPGDGNGEHKGEIQTVTAPHGSGSVDWYEGLGEVDDPSIPSVTIEYTLVLESGWRQFYNGSSFALGILLLDLLIVNQSRNRQLQNTAP